MSAEIRRLLDKWTEVASSEFENGNPQYAQALEQCVIDLEALLPALPPDDPPALEDEKNEARVEPSSTPPTQGSTANTSTGDR